MFLRWLQRGSQRRSKLSGRASVAAYGPMLAGFGLIAGFATGCGGDSGVDQEWSDESLEAPIAEATSELSSLPTPVAHWKLDDPAASMTVSDASGNGATGTKIGGVASTSNGRIGSAAVFDGFDDRIEVT